MVEWHCRDAFLLVWDSCSGFEFVLFGMGAGAILPACRYAKLANDDLADGDMEFIEDARCSLGSLAS